ncbi:MAG TPA: sigma-70 family RNA polymerase sigma factor [Thermoanaerobaculia bacterium]|nr:sigma-70 family RNA polymerase sigma factor [Thermoanaerobaculia bacterium]
MTAFATEALLAGPTPLERAREGDHEAFAGIIAEHQRMVFSLAYHFFHDRSRAEEIAQDVFLQLFRNLSRIESESHLVHWLRQVTSRRCIDQVRRTRLRAVTLDDAGDLAGTESHADPLLGRRLRELIAGLPPKQRVIVTLRYQEDLDPSEICRIVGLPVNTVKSHLHRALRALRKQLGETA